MLKATQGTALESGADWRFVKAGTISEMEKRPCKCSERSCPCKNQCQEPAIKFVKYATVELLCASCAEYAFNPPRWRS
jgi:hypothetical protein